MAAPSPMSESGVRAAVVAAARENALDYYLSALLAPRAYREDLIVLAAFQGELARIPHLASEPMAAEIRLQWWRDWIGAMSANARCGNPLADALADVAMRHDLVRTELLASVDARSQLEPDDATDPIFAYRQLQLAKDCAAMRRSARVMGVLPAAAGGEAAHQDQLFLETCGLAVTFAQMALGERQRLAHSGSDTKFREQLGNLIASARLNLQLAESHVSARPRLLRIAALPVALVEPYLRACEKADADTAADRASADPPMLPLTRTWRLWRAARLGRL